MKNKGLVATIVIMSGIIVMLLVTLLLIKMPSIVGIKNIIIDAGDKTKTTEATSETIIETQETVPPKKVETTILNYSGYNDYVNIEYPEISGMDDEDMQTRLNYKIKMNALSIVGLYPISTALQKLDISCEVKSLTDEFITILYSGKVVGRGVKSSGGSNNSGSSQGKAKVSGSDPYLNGFVDPLTGASMNYQQAPATNAGGSTGGLASIMNSATQNAAAIGNSSLPSPSQNSGTQVFRTNDIAISAANAKASNVKNQSTSDVGPTVYDEPAPTAKKADPKAEAQNQVINGNYATNNPTSNVINSTSTTNNPLIPNSQAPSAEYGPGTQGTSGTTVVQNNPPITGYSGSNTSASTIDQNIFFTNTINIKTCLDVKLSDFADPAELAKYARSSDVEFVNIESENRTEVRNYIKKTVLSKLTDDLTLASDFRNEGLKAWPKHFSYRDEDGTIYFTIKLSSKLGNYAILKYKK